MNYRKLAIATGIAAVLGVVGINTYDVELNQITRRLPFLHVDTKYNLPNTQEAEGLPSLNAISIPNVRDTLEEQIAELLVTTTPNIDLYIPGGILLRKEDTREGHLFGKYPSYSPSRTQKNVEALRNLAATTRKRILVYDEGEGGYVPRVGTLPAAEDIGTYFTHNLIGKTIEGRVTPSKSKIERVQQVEELFANYARELSACGVDAVFGPVLDVPQEGQGNLMKKDGRSFSERHLEVRKIAELYINAMHKEGIRTVGKHFLNVGLSENGDDIHTTTVHGGDRISPRRWSVETYRALKTDLGGVMVTHVGNFPDLNRPYSISRRAMDLLTHRNYPQRHQEAEVFTNNRENEVYENNHGGVDFRGLVVLDDLSMRGLLDYIEDNELSERGKKLTAGCRTEEARAAVIAMEAGAHTFIVFRADTTAIVEGLAYATKVDPPFKKKLDHAIDQYQRFAEARK
ncbi:hypothetical protein J4421_02820 [Candidatus Woesearchaeota archaeon]|nr:hypothetical protein [Candidatus Woesearchaeota archaeon]